MFFFIFSHQSASHLRCPSRQEQRDALEALEHWNWGDYDRDEDAAESAEPAGKAEPAETEAPGGLGWRAVEAMGDANKMKLDLKYLEVLCIYIESSERRKLNDNLDWVICGG